MDHDFVGEMRESSPSFKKRSHRNRDHHIESSSSDSSSGISFSVIGSDGEQIGPCEINEIDISEILQKKFDTDETESSDGDQSPSRSPHRMRPNFNDSGIELSSPGSSTLRPHQLGISSRLLPHMSHILLAKLASDEIHHNTNRFPSHDSYDSDSSSDYEIPLRSIHNSENSGTKNWYKVPTGCLRREYEAIRTTKPAGHFAASRMHQNRHRNRYSDVPCYDHTRVKLRDLSLCEDNDYINGSYCDGFEKRRAYICAQGPLENTTPHFWQMVWENNSRVIVMTTRLVERGKVKCHNYWPTDGEKQVWGYFTVRDTGDTVVENHYIRQKLELEFESQTREIFHFQFTQWPDFGIPKSPSMLLDFQDRVKRSQRGIKAMMTSPYDPPKPDNEDPFEICPIVIHCSAGIGRTGTYLGIDICRDWLDSCSEIQLRDTVNRIRAQRAFCVQTPEQYQFCLAALREVLRRKLSDEEEEEDEDGEEMYDEEEDEDE